MIKQEDVFGALSNIYDDFFFLQIYSTSFSRLKEKHNLFKKWLLNLWSISDKTIMAVGNIKTAASFKSFLHLSYKNA